LESVVFYFLSGVSIVTALMVVASPRPIYAVPALAGCFCAAAGLYGLLGATFLAAVQIIVYAGVVVVVFPIVIVLLDSSRAQSPRDGRGVLRAVAVLAGLLFFGLLVSAVFEGGATSAPLPVEPVRGSFVAMGNLLLHGFALPFLGAAVVVVSSLVGAAWLARR
jgi:NADH-quinone oxidoreductase subunit J